MTDYQLPEDAKPRIHIMGVGGDLHLRGWDKNILQTQSSKVHVEETDDGLWQIHANGNAELYAPLDAEVTIDSVHGDARIIEIDGAVQLGSINGDLVIRDCGMVAVANVHGDMRLSRCGGNAQIGTVNGDATIREVEGETRITAINGDLYVRDVNGPCILDSAGGDLVLSTAFPPGSESAFVVGGDIVCRVNTDADAVFIIEGCSDLNIDAVGARYTKANEASNEAESVIFGEGGAIIALNAGGDIRLVAQDEDYMMALSIQLEEELVAKLDSIEERLSEQLAGLDDLLHDKAERLRVKAERSAEKAMRRTERAMRRTDKKGPKFSFTIGDDMPYDPLRDDEGDRSKKRKRTFAFTLGNKTLYRTPAQEAPPSDPVTDEERMMILRMVEAKQISVEEAEKLLAALEGK